MIKLLLKLALVFFCLLLAVVFYGAYSYKNTFENYAQNFITSEAKRSGLNLAFEDFKLNLFGAKAKTLNMYLPKAFLSLAIDEPRLHFPILAALSLSPALNFSGKLYQSDIDASSSYNIRKHQISGRLKINNLELNKIFLVLSIDQ